MPYLQAGPNRIHYADWPPNPPDSNASEPPRTPIVLVHGLGSSQNYYHALIPHLTAQNHRCIALDTIGSARSPLPASPPTLRTLATNIVSALRTLEIPRAILVGHSMSAGLTLPHLASTYPDVVKALVLLGPVYPVPASVPVFEERIRKVEQGGMESMADTVPDAAVAQQASGVVRAFIREVLLAQDPRGYVAHCKVIADCARGEAGEGESKDDDEITNENRKPDYPKVKCPVLVVAGDEDRSAPVEMCERVFGEIGTDGKEKELVVLEGVGHWMAVEEPGGVGRKVGGWLRGSNGV